MHTILVEFACRKYVYGTDDFGSVQGVYNGTVFMKIDLMNEIISGSTFDLPEITRIPFGFNHSKGV